MEEWRSGGVEEWRSGGVEEWRSGGVIWARKKSMACFLLCVFPSARSKLQCKGPALFCTRGLYYSLKG